jgi:hypothetical protein
MLSAMPAAQIFTILNHYTSRQELDPGFAVLDNSANERPDWFEYWPIRNFLRGETLHEEALYGFLSPRFTQKTNLSAAQVHAFAAADAGCADVILLSPSIHNSAYYLNVFKHGESQHPGLLKTAGGFFERIGRPTDLEELVSDSRNTVHSNYFLAKPRFWREWLAINEQLFAIAETPEDELGQALRAPTAYRGGFGVQMKIFLMERIATWILTTDPGFVARVRDPFAARSRIYKLPVALACDALKIAYSTQRRGQYRDVFHLVSGLRRQLNWRIRVASLMGSGRIRPYLRTLRSYWADEPH